MEQERPEVTVPVPGVCNICGRPTRRRFVVGWRCDEHPPHQAFPLSPAPVREEATVAPWPAPSVPARPARQEETSRGAQSVLKAVRPPWRARATYAKGTPMDRYGKPAPAEVESVAVRLSGPRGARAWGVWVEGKFKAAAVAMDGRLEPLSATALRDLVRGQDDAG